MTYPPEFNWLDDSTVQSVMKSMAMNLRDVERLVEDAPVDQIGNNVQSQVITRLLRIEALAASLSAGSDPTVLDRQSIPSTNHLLIDDHMDEFMNQLLRARLMVETDPPNYYGIGQLVGTCNACHRLR